MNINGSVDDRKSPELDKQAASCVSGERTGSVKDMEPVIGIGTRIRHLLEDVYDRTADKGEELTWKIIEKSPIADEIGAVFLLREFIRIVASGGRYLLTCDSLPRNRVEARKLDREWEKRWAGK